MSETVALSEDDFRYAFRELLIHVRSTNFVTMITDQVANMM